MRLVRAIAQAALDHPDQGVVICAYSRVLTDDAAVSALGIKLRRR